MIYCVGSPSACNRQIPAGQARHLHTTRRSCHYHTSQTPHRIVMDVLFTVFLFTFFSFFPANARAAFWPPAARIWSVSLFADGRTTGGRGSLHPPGQPDRQPDFPARSASRITTIFSCGWRHCHPFSRQKWRPGIHVGATLVLTGLRLFFFLHCTAYPGYGILKRV